MRPEIRRATIEAAMAKAGATASSVDDALALVEDAQKTRMEIREARIAEDRRHQEQLAAIDEREQSMHRTCPHPMVHYVRGTAYDRSCRECDVCGAELD